MKKTGTRRSFFSWTRNALAAAGALRATPSLAATETAGHGEDYYAKLGVTKIINAAGTYTALTASIMPPSVQAAVAACGPTSGAAGGAAAEGGRIYRPAPAVRGGAGQRGRGLRPDLGHGCLHDGGQSAMRSVFCPRMFPA